MGINPAYFGYAQVQQPQGTNGTSRVATGIKAGLFGAGAAGAVTYFGDFKGLTPVGANGNLFEEGLHVLQDSTKIQKGLETASFNAQRTFLNGKGIAVNSAKDYTALSEYVKTGKIAEDASAAQKDIFAKVLADSSSTIHSDLNALVRNSAGKNFETEVLPNINKFLQQHGLAEVKDKVAYNNLMSALQTHSGEAYTDTLKEALAKDYKSVIDGANVAGKKAAFETAAGITGAENVSFNVANQYLSSLKRSESYWKSLPETKDGILEFLKKQSGKTGEELDKILPKLNDAAEKLVQKRTAALAEGGIATKIAKQEDLVNGIKTNLQTKFKGFYDNARGALKKDAPKELVQFFKEFKWAKAGKYALITGAVALVGGLLFGGNKA